MECFNVPGVAGSADMKICQLCAVDFTILDHDDCHDPIVANNGSQVEKCEAQFDDSLTLDHFYDGIRAIHAGLSHVEDILSDTPPGCLDMLHPAAL